MPSSAPLSVVSESLSLPVGLRFAQEEEEEDGKLEKRYQALVAAKVKEARRCGLSRALRGSTCLLFHAFVQNRPLSF